MTNSALCGQIKNMGKSTVWNDIKRQTEEGVRTLGSALSETSGSASSYSAFNDFGSDAETIGRVVDGLYGGIILPTAENPRSGQIYDIATAFEAIHANNFCTFDDKMGVFMDRLMSININEKNVTLSLLGKDAMFNGDSTRVTPDAGRPSYAEGRNYLDYVEQVNYASGEMTTRETNNVNMLDYKDGNEIYRGTTFLYPDDNGTGLFTNKWRASLNRNSLLYKTKRLFAERKIKTLISRFGSNADPTSVDLDYTARKGTTTGGESRGRNLLNRGRENINYNGYNNPYCRVWTHHHRYDRVWKMIRPFQGNSTLEDMHGYLKVGQDNTVVNKDGTKVPDPRFGSKGWNYSVLSNDKEGHYTGFVNIAPKFRGGMSMNIHPKQCMFSIENLAWRGFNPYEFEKALSWEQRGPLGGRIMWFPPYGISFNETSSARWESNTFIGRGEDVYTYVNTQRTGNLSFLMVIDHPSVLDYATWYDNGKNWGGGSNATSNGITDEEILQFFAGCDSGDSNDKANSLFGKAKPTTLTDEYRHGKGDIAYIDKPLETPPEAVQPDPEDNPNDVERTVEFYVFFPNNYSGVFDGCDDILGREVSSKKSDGSSFSYTLPNPIMYLMFGQGAQTFGDDADEPYMRGRFGDEIDYAHGVGYEMESGDLGDATYLKGVLPQTLKWMNAKSGETYSYSKKAPVKWYYRIDADFSDENYKTSGYAIPSGNGRYTDQRCQILPKGGKYRDGNNLQLNYDIKNITKIGNQEIVKDNLYPAAMVISALLETRSNNDKEITNIANLLKSRLSDSDTYNELLELFKDALTKKRIQSVTVEGYSSTDGLKSGNKWRAKRNELLAQQRADSVIAFINSCNSAWGAKRGDVFPDAGGGKNAGTLYQNENAAESKLNRCAKVVIQFSGEAATDVPNTAASVPATSIAEGDGAKTESVEALDGVVPNTDAMAGVAETKKSVGFNPIPDTDPKLYKDENGGVWYEEGETDDGKIILRRIDQRVSRFNGDDFDGEGFKNGGENEKNISRYDQEYHFFRQLERDNPLVFNRLMDRLKYFDPAFHSMTPEGFNARLTFLNQCTRQGNTLTMSGPNARTANNLAFGRAPFCVLRLGDFYNQLIVIDNITLDYSVSDGILWDLNPEGAGVQPMLCSVNISFKFIGGGDMAGPIRRLQNAMSFNYYANTRLYDNRADRVKYKGNDIEEGAIDWGIDGSASYAYNAALYHGDVDEYEKFADENTEKLVKPVAKEDTSGPVEEDFPAEYDINGISSIL